MDIKQELQDFKKCIDGEIEKFLDVVEDEAGQRDILFKDIVQHLRKFIFAGGKRLRPALMYHGYLAAGGEEKEKILRSCVSIELIHAFLLIHDDIIDRDNERHGVDTVHHSYAKLGKRLFLTDDHEHFGASMGIIVGDLGAALGSQCLFTSEFAPDIVIKALRKLQSIVSFTIVGEARDVYMEYMQNATESDVLNMYTNKTAKYTIEGPLHLGVTLAGGEHMLRQMTDYAVPLGIAFQIQDDILGVFGDKKKVGKPEGSDIREGKMTLLVVKSLELADKDRKKRLQELVGNEEITKNEIGEVKNIMRDTGALDYAKDLAQKYVQESQKALEDIDFKNSQAKEFLYAMAEFMIKREV